LREGVIISILSQVVENAHVAYAFPAQKSLRSRKHENSRNHRGAPNFRVRGAFFCKLALFLLPFRGEREISKTLQPC